MLKTGETFSYNLSLVKVLRKQFQRKKNINKTVIDAFLSETCLKIGPLLSSSWIKRKN